MATQQWLQPRYLAWRWLVGMALVSWRYLWATTPLHRTETRHEPPRLPPELPAEVSTAGMQPWQCGTGPIYHRTFRVHIAGSRTDAAALMDVVARCFGDLVPREVVRVRRRTAPGRRLAVGDDMVVDMPGPWNGPVRVVELDRTKLRLATLEGHLEAGQIEFRALNGVALDAPLTFEVESWARPADRRVRLLYSHLGLAKEVQLNMWVRFCQAVVAFAGGRCVDGIHIHTMVGTAPDV